MNGYIALERQWLIEGFKRLPPDVVLIDNLRDGWGERAKADAELAQFLKPYVFVQTIEGIDILRRSIDLPGMIIVAPAQNTFVAIDVVSGSRVPKVDQLCRARPSSYSTTKVLSLRRYR